MGFDAVFNEIGDFGPFQKYVIFLVNFKTGIYSGLLFINSFFILAIPNHRCAIPGLANDTYAVQNSYHRHLINVTIPPSEDPDIVYDQCSVYVPSTDGQLETRKCDKWVYDRSIFESTLAADLNMVCDQSILKSSAQMMFFGGLLTGSFITGLLSDRFGRKTTLCASSIFYFAAALAITWANSYALYVFLLFSVGFFSVGNFMPSFVMSMEFVGPSMRRFAGNVGGITWTLGNIILAGLGYAIRDWHTLQLVCALPGILFQLFWFDKILPESPRWLFSKGRRQEAEKIIDRAANMAKVTLPDKFYDKVFVDSDKIPQGKIWHLFKSKTLAIRTLVIFFNWLVVCLAYYGLALNSGDIGGDMYLNFFLQSLMDLPATIILIVLLDRTGRKPLLVASMLLGGFGCLATVFTMIYGGKSYEIATKVLAMVGKFGASAGFSMVYIYSAELFPTVVRNAGMGSSSCMARVGGMIAPYIADLDRLIGGRVGKAMPQIIFGSLSIVAGIMALILPETLNRNLPETIQDGENFGKEPETDKELIVNGSKDIVSKDINTGAIVNKAFSEDAIVSRL